VFLISILMQVRSIFPAAAEPWEVAGRSRLAASPAQLMGIPLLLNLIQAPQAHALAQRPTGLAACGTRMMVIRNGPQANFMGRDNITVHVQ